MTTVTRVVAAVDVGAGSAAVDVGAGVANIEARKQVAADHQARARVGHQAVATRLEADVERMVTALSGHEYSGGPIGEHLKHPSVVAAAEIAASLQQELGVRCFQASIVVGTGMLTFVEDGCGTVESRCHEDAYEQPGTRVESCDFVVEGKQVSSLGIEVTRQLRQGELQLRIRGLAA